MIKQNIEASRFEEAFFNSIETYVHPTSIIGKNVVLQDNVKIGPYCVITGNVTIESGTRLHASVMVGQPAQARGVLDSRGSVIIKKNCEIREFVTIHASKYADGTTSIGNNCYVMNFCHISHDVVLEDNVTLTNSVNLGGHTYIEQNVNMMANSATHQFCRVGQYAALAPYSAIRQDLPPFGIYSGLPAVFGGLNIIGLKRAGLADENIGALRHVTRLYYREKLMLDDIKDRAAQDEWGQDLYAQAFLKFVESSSRGVSRDNEENKRKSNYD